MLVLKNYSILWKNKILHLLESFSKSKVFSLSCAIESYDYDKAILSLLYRMSNLKQRALCLTVYVMNTLIDEKHLKTKIIKHISRLNQFTFFIQIIHLYWRWNKFSIDRRYSRDIYYRNNNIISYVQGWK